MWNGVGTKPCRCSRSFESWQKKKKVLHWVLHSMSGTSSWPRALKHFHEGLGGLWSVFLLGEILSQWLQWRLFLNKQRLSCHLSTHGLIRFFIATARYIEITHGCGRFSKLPPSPLPFFLSYRFESEWRGSLGPRPYFEQAHYQPEPTCKAGSLHLAPVNGEEAEYTQSN